MTSLQTTLFTLVAASAVTGCASLERGVKSYLAGIQAAEVASTPFAPVSEYVPTISLSQAYKVQQQYISKRVRKGDRTAGFKSGLMSAASLKARNVSDPLVGVLFQSGAIASGNAISLCGYRRASFELKLGFMFARPVTQIADISSGLEDSVAEVVAVIDLPDIAYSDPDRYTAVDMIAANISAARYVMGPRRSPLGLDLDNLKVTISRNGDLITGGLGRESLGGQFNSLTRVVREVLRSGRTVRKGDLVITGKIGDRGWLTSGNYSARYGDMGVANFTVEACPKNPNPTVG